MEFQKLVAGTRMDKSNQKTKVAQTSENITIFQYSCSLLNSGAKLHESKLNTVLEFKTAETRIILMKRSRITPLDPKNASKFTEHADDGLSTRLVLAT